MEIKIAAFIIFPLIFIAKFLINYENNKVVRCTANAIINRAGLLAKVKIELSMSDENGVFLLMETFIVMIFIMVQLVAGFFLMSKP